MAIANALAFLLYLCCSVILIRGFVKHDPQHSASVLPVGLLTILALIFHGSHLFFTMQAAGGWQLNLLTTASIATWLMAFLAMLGGLRWPIAHPGIVVYPIVALSLMFQVEAPGGSGEKLADPALEWHILLSLAAYSLFTLAALQAVLLAIQEKHLRHHHLGRLMRRLPPLQTMESALFQLILCGFVLLTLGLITGFVFVEDLLAQHLAHKTIFSLIAWSVFASLLWGRYRFGWRSQTAVRWTLVGFFFLLLAYVGSKIVLEYILKIG